MANVHLFDTLGEAYDASQIDLGTGVVLVIESRKVVGLSWKCPIAVTKPVGPQTPCAFYDIEPGYEAKVIEEAGFGHYDIVDAVKQATKRGYELAEWAKKYIA